VHSDAAVAARGDRDGDGDEFAGLGVEMGGFVGAPVERDEASNGIRRFGKAKSQR